jgi:hypothetical protein
VFKQIKKNIDQDLKHSKKEISDPSLPIKRKKKQIKIQNLKERKLEANMENLYESKIQKLEIRNKELEIRNKELEEEVFRLKLKLLKIEKVNSPMIESSSDSGMSEEEIHQENK